MDILLIASWCGAITTITSFLYGAYKLMKGFEDKFDFINESIQKSEQSRIEEIKGVNDTVIELNNKIIDAFNSNTEEINEKFEKVNRKIEEDTLLTLKLAIMNPNLDISEKIKYGELYIELGGNGPVGRHLNDLIKQYNETHFKSDSNTNH